MPRYLAVFGHDFDNSTVLVPRTAVVSVVACKLPATLSPELLTCCVHPDGRVAARGSVPSVQDVLRSAFGCCLLCCLAEVASVETIVTSDGMDVGKAGLLAAVGVAMTSMYSGREVWHFAGPKFSSCTASVGCKSAACVCSASAKAIFAA